HDGPLRPPDAGERGRGGGAARRLPRTRGHGGATSSGRMIDGASQLSLEQMGVASVEDLLAMPTDEIAKRLTAAPFPPSEKLIGAVLLKAVDDLRETTAAVAESSRRLEAGTEAVTRAAWLTLTVAVAA